MNSSLCELQFDHLCELAIAKRADYYRLLLLRADQSVKFLPSLVELLLNFNLIVGNRSIVPIKNLTNILIASSDTTKLQLLSRNRHLIQRALASILTNVFETECISALINNHNGDDLSSDSY